MQTVDNRLIRMPQVLDAMGEKKSRFYALAQAGLMPRPIKIGTQAAVLPEYEVRAVNAARIRGATEAELRAVVADLHARRTLAA